MTNKNTIEQESGRSMVEMLGVLAIIGVLSVGGISGYTTAMNKHKANEILNAAAVRAMAVSAQIQSGVDPSTATAGVTTETVGTAEIGSASPVGTEQFKLVFTNDIDESICKQMKNMAGDNSAVGVACDRLLYNNDMSTGVDNKNTNVESVSDASVYTCKNGFDPASKCEDCPTGYGVNASGACEACTAGQIVKSGVCTSCSENQIVKEGACVSCPTGNDWTSGTADTYTGATVSGYEGCKCPADQVWKDNKCQSSGPTCTGNEHEVTYVNGDGSKHCVEIILGNFNHAQAYNECLNVSTGRHLMETSEFQSAFTANGGDYSADLTAKIGWTKWEYIMWLGTCFKTTCQAAGYLNDDGTMKDDDSNVSGSAWYVAYSGGMGYDYRDIGGFRSGDDVYYALCVR